MIKFFEEKFELEVFIFRKFYDEWEFIIKFKIKNYECNVLCDLGVSVSAILKFLCDVLGFNEIEECFYNLYFADYIIKKFMGRINDVFIIVNRNYVFVDFIVFDIDCNFICFIIFGRFFLRIIGVIIDMKEGNIRFKFF